MSAPSPPNKIILIADPRAVAIVIKENAEPIIDRGRPEKSPTFLGT